jgi:hypothetical protein
MVGAHGSPSSPPRGATVDVFCIDGGRYRISVTPSQGSTVDVFLRCMMGALGSSKSPPRGPVIDAFCIEWWALPDLQHHLPGGMPLTLFALNGGRSQISSIASQGPAIDVFCVDGGRSRIFITAFQGPTVDIFLH